VKNLQVKMVEFMFALVVVLVIDGMKSKITRMPMGRNHNVEHGTISVMTKSNHSNKNGLNDINYQELHQQSKSE
jgi:hypothetical protein